MFHEYKGLNPASDPSEVMPSAVALRIWVLKYHPEYYDTFITGGWENHLKVFAFVLTSSFLFIVSLNAIFVSLAKHSGI